MEYDHQHPTLIRLKKICRNYLREVMDVAMQAVLLLVSTTVLCLIVLYFYNVLWHLFRMTYSGKKFSILHPKTTQLITDIVSNDLIEVAVHATFSAFTICFIIAAICRVSHITRYFYYSQNMVTKLLFGAMPLTALVSIYVNEQIKLEHWSYAVTITIVPTLCVFTYCFKFTESLLPEFGDVMLKIFQSLKDFFSTAPNPRPPAV